MKKNLIALSLLLTAIAILANISTKKAEVEPANSKVSAADCYVYASGHLNWNITNWGAYDRLVVGTRKAGLENRTYLRFPLPEDLQEDERAILELWQYHSEGDSSAIIGVFEVLEPWEEGDGVYEPDQFAERADPGEISYQNQPKFSETPALIFSANTTPGILQADLTSLVRKWKAGQANYGIVLRPVDSEFAVAGFYSKEHENSEFRPRLRVEKEEE